MSLIYRGQTAQLSSTTETVNTGMMGTFMGCSFPIRKAQQSMKRSTPILQFRGSLY